MLKISVIIPVYNAVQYLDKCIQSVQQQTLVEWEMIIVDDGSTDGSGELCDKYSIQDARIVTIHQDNAGPGQARNVGLENARGEYIVFIDSDDYIEPEYFSLLSKHTEDVVFIDINGVLPDGHVVRKEYLSKYSKLDKELFLRKQMTGSISWGGVRKAVKRDIIKGNSIKYSKHKIGEEAIYSFLILYYAQTIGFISTPVYSYLQRIDSQSHLATEDPWGEVALNLRARIKDLGVYEKYATTLNSFILAAATGSTYRIASNYSYHVYKRKIEERYNKFLNDRDPKYGFDNESLSLRVKVLGYLFNCRMFFLAWLLSRLKKKH